MYPVQFQQQGHQMAPAGGGFALQPLTAQMMIPNLPWRPPFNLNLNVPPHMQEHVQYAVGHVLHELQIHANQNEMRLLLYWTAAQNQFNNDLFIGLVYNVLDYTEFMIATQGRMYSPNDFIAKGAADSCKIMAVQLGSQHPSIMAKVSPQGQQDMQQTMQYAQALVQQIQQYKMSVQHQQPQGQFGLGAGVGFPQHQAQPGFVGRAVVGGGASYPGPRSMQGGGGFPSNPGQSFVPGTSYNDLFNNGGGAGPRTLTGERMMLPGSVVTEENKQPVITGGSGVTTDLKAEVPPFMLMAAIAGKDTQTAKEKVEMTAAQPMTTAPKPATPVQNTNSPKTPFPAKPPKEAFVWEGRKFIHANFAKFKPCHAIGLPYGTVYDPSKVAMFFEITDPKAIREVAVQLEVFGGMQPYEVHETFHLLNPRIADKGVAPNREQARQAFLQTLQTRDIAVILEEREQKQSADGNIGKYLVNEPVSIDDLTLKGLVNPVYHQVVELFFENNDLTMPEDKVITFHYEGSEPWTLKGEAAIKALELKYSKNWDVLYSRMQALRTLAHPTYWNIVHQRLTDAVNELVTKVMGVQARITHFVEDLGALRAHLRDACGDTVADYFDNMATNLAQRACLFMEVAAPEGETAPTEVSYLTLEDIFLLPCNAEDLALNYTGESAVVTEKRMPELYAALKRYFENQSNDTNADFVRHTKFITRDGKLTVFATKGVYAADTYLVYTDR